VDDVLELIPEIVEEGAGARVKIPGQKKRLEVGDHLGIFDGAVHVSVVERVPHLFERKERTEHAVVGDDEAVELIERPAAPPEDAPCEVPRAEVEGKCAAGVNAGAERADESDRLRREGGRAGDENDGCSKPVQCLQVIGDVRIDDALWVEVCEQNERAGIGRGLRCKLHVRFAEETESVVAQAMTRRGQGAL
jgi:hypothetical protein